MLGRGEERLTFVACIKILTSSSIRDGDWRRTCFSIKSSKSNVLAQYSHHSQSLDFEVSNSTPESTPGKAKHHNLTGPKLHSLSVILSHIVLYPRPVDILPLLLDRSPVVPQHGRHGKVAQEAGRHGHLQGEPVFALADVEDVACVCGACCPFLDVKHTTGEGGNEEN